MDQAVHAAHVHKGAEVGQAADDAVDDHALLQLLPGFLLLGGGFLRHHGLAAGDDALLLLVDLNDLQLHFLADEISNLFHIALGQLGGGHEGANALDIGDQAALDGLLAGAVHIFARFILCHQGFPGLAVDNVALAEQHIALAVVYLHDLHFDLVAQLHVGLGELGALDQAVGLVADVDAHLVVGHLNDGAGHGLTGANLHQGCFDFGHEVLVFNVSHAGYYLLK